MTAQVLPFRFDTHEVRTMLIDDQPWFVASDVASVLQYRNAPDMTRNLDDDEKGTQIVRTLGGSQEMLIINESGLYSAILRSRKPEAKRFKKWVTAEVLPAIRRSGHYSDNNDSMATLLNATIGTDGFHMLGAIIDGKTRRLPTARRRAATTHMWEQVHRAFGVARGADIPASQLDAARNFVAAYALEGEWLPAETGLQPGSTCTKSQTRPVSDYPLSLWDQLDPIRKHLPKHFSLDAVMISQRLMFGMDRQITPLDNLLRELDALGVDVGALKLELKSMRHHLEMFDSAAREIGEVIARRRAA